MGFAADTTITIPSGVVQISELRAGDLVLAASFALVWQQYTVKSAETTVGTTPMVYLTVGPGTPVVVTPDQLVLTSDFRLTRSDNIQIGDQLLGAGGQAVMVSQAYMGNYQGDVCDVATSAETQTDGHLIEANGIIAADYELQIEGSGS